MFALKCVALLITFFQVTLASTDVLTIKQELVKIASKIQILEADKLKVLKKIRDINAQSSSISDAFFTSQRDVMKVVKRGRFELVPPTLLSVLQGSNTKETLHTLMLLKFLSSKIYKKIQKTKKLHANLAGLKNQKAILTKDLSNLSRQYHQLNGAQNQLIEKKYKLIKVSTVKAAATKSLSNDAIGDVVSMFDRDNKKSDMSLEIAKPVIGDIQKKIQSIDI